jgi:predicted ATPase
VRIASGAVSQTLRSWFAELDASTVTDALASLVAKSMLGTETGPAGETRYTMLETLRQYAREQLDETGDTDRCRRAQAHHIGVIAPCKKMSRCHGSGTTSLWASTAQ